MIPFHGLQECSLIIPPGFSATAQQVDKKITEQKKKRCIAATVVNIFHIGLKKNTMHQQNTNLKVTHWL